MKNNFKYHISENKSFRFVFEQLKLSSTPAREMLIRTEMMTDETKLKTELNYLDNVYDFYKTKLSKYDITDIALLLHSFKDIENTLVNLKNDKIVLDDIQLFEIKNFLFITKRIVFKIKEKGFDVFEFYKTDEILDILDPDNSHENSFYIYSSYSPELKKLRAEYTEQQKKNPDIAEKIRLQCLEIEDEIRKDLTIKLRKYSEELNTNFKRLAHFDLLLAKSILIEELNLSKPSFSDKLEYVELCNPFVDSLLKEKGKKFQTIDIELSNKPVLITGANMSGKTVILRTLALAQLMFQFGFYVPAKSAKLKLFDEIILNIGDNHDEMNGLSSFAMEMKNIDKIIVKSRQGIKILALVDELARTTNPTEGKILVSAFIEMMKKFNVFSAITTHYGGIGADCKRLVVKGLSGCNYNSRITIDNINDYMDYTLCEVETDAVPNEAIRIAEILGVDEEYLSLIKK